MSRIDGYFQRVRKLNKRPGKRNGSTLLEHDIGGGQEDSQGGKSQIPSIGSEGLFRQDLQNSDRQALDCYKQEFTNSKEDCLWRMRFGRR